MRAAALPGWYWRNCQKVSPWPTRRRPCTPCATVEATRSAATSSGGRAAAARSARGGPPPAATTANQGYARRSPQRRRHLVDHLRDADPFGAPGEADRHAV